MDLYELLEIAMNAEEKDIRKAYRKKTLSCHPDKNPDNPKAADLFQQLSKALEILTDATARAAYDKTLKAWKAAQVRHRELDQKRRKLKEDLEAREKYAQEEQETDSAENLQKEMERLRKEGSKRLEEEKELLRQQIEKEKLGLNKLEMPRLKVKWKSHKSDEGNGGYDQEVLDNMFKKYGQVICLVSSKRKGSAIIEFLTPEAAQQAFEYEKGILENPLTLLWICGQPEITTCGQPAPELRDDAFQDFENEVLSKLQQAGQSVCNL